MSALTPMTGGRWNASEQGTAVWNDEGRRIATIVSGNIGDARGIAALPELLAAAERVFADAHDRGETHDKGSSELYSDWEALRAALAKARGE